MNKPDDLIRWAPPLSSEGVDPDGLGRKPSAWFGQAFIGENLARVAKSDRRFSASVAKKSRNKRLFRDFLNDERVAAFIAGIPGQLRAEGLTAHH